jgi:hypothetical protein
MEQNFNNAKKEIRTLGVKVKVNVMECCRGCIGTEKLGLKDENQPYIYTYGGQGNAISWVDGLPFLRSDAKKWRLSDKDLVNSEYFNHGNLTPELSKQIVEIFQRNGFVVNWDGGEFHCIEIDFKATKNNQDVVMAAEAILQDVNNFC